MQHPIKIAPYNEQEAIFLGSIVRVHYYSSLCNHILLLVTLLNGHNFYTPFHLSNDQRTTLEERCPNNYFF